VENDISAQIKKLEDELISVSLINTSTYPLTFLFFEQVKDQLEASDAVKAVMDERLKAALRVRWIRLSPIHNEPIPFAFSQEAQVENKMRMQWQEKARSLRLDLVKVKASPGILFTLLTHGVSNSFLISWGGWRGRIYGGDGEKDDVSERCPRIP